MPTYIIPAHPANKVHRPELRVWLPTPKWDASCDKARLQMLDMHASILGCSQKCSHDGASHIEFDMFQCAHGMPSMMYLCIQLD